MKKKILIVIGALLAIFIATAIVLPLVVDVDKFRPQIVQAVNDHINGEFKMGKLELSLWGGLKVKVASLSLKGIGNTKSILETDAAYFEVPLLSVLKFSPTIVAVLSHPKVDIVKSPTGKLNLMALMKETPSTPGATTTAPTPSKPAEAAGKSSGIPAIAAAASVGLRIEKGVFSYTDEEGGAKYLIDGVDLDVRNLGFRQTIQVALQMPIKGSSPTMQLDGMIEAHAKVTPIVADGALRSASGLLEFDGSKLEFSMSHGMVQKTTKMPMKLVMNFDGTANDLRIQNMDVTFADLTVNTKGLVQLQPKQAVQMKVHSNQLNLASLEAIVPMLKAYQLAGAASLDMGIEGPMDQLAIKGELNVSGGKAAYPEMLKGPVTFETRTEFTEKSLHLTNLVVGGPGLAADLKGTVEDFKAPRFNFALTAKEIDIDKLLKTEPAKKSASFFIGGFLPEAEAAPQHSKNSKKHAAVSKAAKKETSAADEPTASSGANPMLSLAKNPIMANASGTFTANISKLVAKGAPVTDISAKVALKNMVLTVEEASLKAFEGVMNAKAVAVLKTAGLNFNTSGTVKGLNAKAAISTYVPKFQNTLEGKMNANWSLAGIAFPSSAILHTLNGSVNITAENGRLRSIDMQDSIKGILSKVSFLKNQSVPNIDENFKSMRADLKFAGGVIDANPLEIVGTEKGVTLKGKSKIQENLTQDTYVDVYDPNHLLPKEISNGKDAVMQMHVTGLVSSPQTDYGYTVGRLAKSVVKNQGAEAISNGLKKALGGKVPISSDAIGGALKKLGF